MTNRTAPFKTIEKPKVSTSPPPVKAEVVACPPPNAMELDSAVDIRHAPEIPSPYSPGKVIPKYQDNVRNYSSVDANIRLAND